MIIMERVEMSDEYKEILNNIKELESAENRKDIKGILELITEDFVFVNRNAKLEGKEETGRMLEKSTQDFISSKHFPFRVEISSSGDMAWLLAYELNERERDGSIVETKQYYMLTFKKVEGRWKQTAVCLT
jgi:ketosteroid isomerase-like protein